MTPSPLALAPEHCQDLDRCTGQEWLITNGIGGYGCGTVAGVLTRHYHGYLVAALRPPLGRTLLFTKLMETVQIGTGDTATASTAYALGCDRWADGTVTDHGYRHLHRFQLAGSIPLWTYRCGDARLEKRLWMEPGANTTYCRYTLVQASAAVTLTVQGFANYRDHHHSTHRPDWRMAIATTAQGVRIQAHPDATPFYWWCDRAPIRPAPVWYRHYGLAVEAYRGIDPTDDHLRVGTATCTLQPGSSVTFTLTTEATADRDGAAALARRQHHDARLLPPITPRDSHCDNAHDPHCDNDPKAWHRLHLAADQFIVDRTVAGQAGKTIIAGYPWFGDWGRDTMIALPGLTLTTGRFEVARFILQTFAQYIDRGMVPNLFPEAGETPGYNTVDASLWYIEAVRAYGAATGDRPLLRTLFPVLRDMVDWHLRGTRYGIGVDDDGLLRAGEAGTQLTWMDAKVGDWVVTPRVGKPVEVNALWYNALVTVAAMAQQWGDRPTAQRLTALAAHSRRSFQTFWRSPLGYCCDVLDGPAGDDTALRPNQILAVALPEQGPPLLTPTQQKAVVDQVAAHLLTPYGLRSLSPTHGDYQGRYGGSPRQRDGGYHQGTVWGWLIGPFVQAHLRVYQNPIAADRLLRPLRQHLSDAGVGTLSEIFDGDAPFTPRGAIAQAWTVAAVLQATALVRDFTPSPSP
jgi:predicted glycogen debranching enzyme